MEERSAQKSDALTGHSLFPALQFARDLVHDVIEDAYGLVLTDLFRINV